MTTDTQPDVTLVQMTYERMQALLHQAFHLEDGREITLVEVVEIARKQPALHSWQKPAPEPAAESGQRKPFKLVFRFPVDQPTQQGIYGISHPTEGAFEGTFLVPIAEDEDGRYFEAVFN
jgi:hypothetical protein